jgi:hypothetical protein
LSSANGDIAALYGSVGQSDALPTAAQVNAASSVEKDVEPLLQRWNTIKERDLPRLNQQLKQRSMPEIQLQTSWHVDEPLRGDEE